MEHEWTLALAGALSMAFGALLALPSRRRGLGRRLVARGAYAMVYGILMTVFGFRLRSYMHSHTSSDLPAGGGLHQPT